MYEGRLRVVVERLTFSKATTFEWKFSTRGERTSAGGISPFTSKGAESSFDSIHEKGQT